MTLEPIDVRAEAACARLGAERIAPALWTATAFQVMAGLARDGKTTKAGIPKNPLQGAIILRHFEDEIYFVRPCCRSSG